MNVVKAFGQFWYEFIIGDDWKIATAVVLALAISAAALQAKIFSDTGLAIGGGALIVVFFAVSLAIDVRPRR